jgi:hypothetical protein
MAGSFRGREPPLSAAGDPGERARAAIGALAWSKWRDFNMAFLIREFRGLRR